MNNAAISAAVNHSPIVARFIWRVDERFSNDVSIELFNNGSVNASVAVPTVIYNAMTFMRINNVRNLVVDGQLIQRKL